MFRVDAKDLVIMREKERDPDARPYQIAPKTGLTPTGVQYRPTRLMDRGILRHRYEIDEQKLAEAS